MNSHISSEAYLQELRNRMEEVAALPSNHPDRLAMLEHISRIGGSIEAEWLALLRFDEELRIQLSRVVVPSGMRSRLLEIPRRASGHRRVRLLGPFLELLLGPRRLAVAASLGVIVFLALAVAAWKNDNLHEFAALAVAAHASQPELALVTDDWELVRASYREQMPIDPLRPKPPSHWTLIGARLTNFDDRAVLYSRWTDGDRTYSLSVYCAEQFRLPRQSEQRELIPRLLGEESGRRVVFWSDRHCDYVLVVDDATVPVHRFDAQAESESVVASVFVEPRHLLPI